MGDEMVPRQVMALGNVFVLQVSCGHSHCAVITETGDVWAWGASRAFGHTEPGAVPDVATMIKVLSGKAIVQVACGVTHSIALSDYRRTERWQQHFPSLRSEGGYTLLDPGPHARSICDRVLL